MPEKLLLQVSRLSFDISRTTLKVLSASVNSKGGLSSSAHTVASYQMIVRMKPSHHSYSSQLEDNPLNAICI